MRSVIKVTKFRYLLKAKKKQKTKERLVFLGFLFSVPEGFKVLLSFVEKVFQLENGLYFRISFAFHQVYLVYSSSAEVQKKTKINRLLNEAEKKQKKKFFSGT